MYRAVTLAWIRSGSADELFRQRQWLYQLDLAFRGRKVFLDGVPVSLELRGDAVTKHVSLVAAEPEVRAFLTHIQRKMGSSTFCILDGRDIGTVVFPDAFFKVFLTASPEERARRRWLQLGGERGGITLEQVLRDQSERDRKDSSRALAPLKKAADALELCTDGKSLEEVVAVLSAEARRRLRRLECGSVSD